MRQQRSDNGRTSGTWHDRVLDDALVAEQSHDLCHADQDRNDAQQAQVLDRRIAGELAHVKGHRADDEHAHQVAKQDLLAAVAIAPEQPDHENQVVEIRRHECARRDYDDDCHVKHGCAPLPSLRQRNQLCYYCASVTS